ncbi:hypothetical protein FRC09_019815 [Ceratobasidium sp. 395]|nr:hypothetical protein FRC09_019815 [Ceratobasidium sp. 395]
MDQNPLFKIPGAEVPQARLRHLDTIKKGKRADILAQHRQKWLDAADNEAFRKTADEFKLMGLSYNAGFDQPQGRNDYVWVTTAKLLNKEVTEISFDRPALRSELKGVDASMEVLEIAKQYHKEVNSEMPEHDHAHLRTMIMELSDIDFPAETTEWNILDLQMFAQDLAKEDGLKRVGFVYARAQGVGHALNYEWTGETNADGSEVWKFADYQNDAYKYGQGAPKGVTRSDFNDYTAEYPVLIYTLDCCAELDPAEASITTSGAIAESKQGLVHVLFTA